MFQSVKRISCAMSSTKSPPASSSRATSGSTSGTAAGRSALVVSLLLFLSFFYFLCSTSRMRTMDEVSAAYQVESLARRGTPPSHRPSKRKCSTARSTVDRRWIFLLKAGVSTGTVLVLAGLLLLGAAASAWWLHRAISKTTAAAA
jgi:hypothetical protein